MAAKPVPLAAALTGAPFGVLTSYGAPCAFAAARPQARWPVRHRRLRGALVAGLIGVGLERGLMVNASGGVSTVFFSGGSADSETAASGGAP